MGMPRKTASDLPARLHLKSGGYYYVYQNTWDLLSRDKGKAVELAKSMNALTREQRWIALGKMRLGAADLRRSVLERDCWACVYCGSKDDLGIDHIIPFEAGGASLPFNLVTACGACNLSKGMSDPRVFIALLADGREQIIAAIIRHATALLDTPEGQSRAST
jgi:hypothetical protein